MNAPTADEKKRVTSAERRRADRHLQRAIRQAVEQGWVVECVETKAEDSESYRTILYLRHDGFNVEEKGVM